MVLHYVVQYLGNPNHCSFISWMKMNNSLLSFLISPELMPFHLCVMGLVMISIIETIGFYLGLHPLRFLRKIVPLPINSSIFQVKFSKILVLIFFLINFSFAGYFFQLAFFSYLESFVPIVYIIFPTLFVATFFTIFMIHCLDQVIRPQLENKKPNLVGRLATISSGCARPNHTAQANVRDEYGQLHLIQVRSEFGEIPKGALIILIRQKELEYIAKKISESNHLFDYELFPHDNRTP